MQENKVKNLAEQLNELSPEVQQMLLLIGKGLELGRRIAA